MPKQLTRPQPTSSVAGMLESGLGGQVMAKPRPQVAPIVPIPVTSTARQQVAPKTQLQPLNDVPGIARQFKLSPVADNVLRLLVRTFHDVNGIDLKYSELLRAILTAVQPSMATIAAAAEELGKLKRPKNDRTNELLQAELERKVATAIAVGIARGDPGRD